jgi:hypothetical protein
MLRRQLINTVRRYSHQHCEKNIPQININCEKNEKNEKIDQLLENNKQFINLDSKVDPLHSKIDILFLIYSVMVINIYIYKQYKKLYINFYGY